MITETNIDFLSARAHQYRWSSTCCSASERRAAARLPRPVDPRICSRTDCPPAAIDHPMPFGTAVYDNDWLARFSNLGSYLSSSNKRHRRTWPSADVAPNKSTIGWLALLVGELRKGFVLLVGDCTFACNTYIGGLIQRLRAGKSRWKWKKKLKWKEGISEISGNIWNLNRKSVSHMNSQLAIPRVLLPCIDSWRLPLPRVLAVAAPRRCGRSRSARAAHCWLLFRTRYWWKTGRTLPTLHWFYCCFWAMIGCCGVDGWRKRGRTRRIRKVRFSEFVKCGEREKGA